MPWVQEDMIVTAETDLRSLSCLLNKIHLWGEKRLKDIIVYFEIIMTNPKRILSEDVGQDQCTVLKEEWASVVVYICMSPKLHVLHGRLVEGDCMCGGTVAGQAAPWWGTATET